jgi:3-keto-5-aminohexanoate cleavage enzyme
VSERERSTFGGSDLVVITVAGIGAEVTKDAQPSLPLLPEEVGAEYGRAFDAGATVGHVHGRRPDGTPTQDLETFRAFSAAIRARCPIVQQFSTGGEVGMDVEERIAALELRPEMATLTLGTCNFGEDVFENSLPTIRAILERLRRYGVVPELEIFDAGMLATADALFAKGLLTIPSHFDFVLGVPGAAAATPENLVHFARSIPKGCTWSVAGIGRHQTRMATLALAMGGHVRVGFEDNAFYRKGELATSNAQLVERVVRIAREVGREPASVEETRAMLGLRGASVPRAS